MTDETTSDHDGTSRRRSDETDSFARRWLLRTGALASGGALFGSTAAAGRETTTGDDSETADDAETADDSEYNLNEADVSFIQEMIPHHWGAVIMSRLVPDYSDRQPLIDLAERMRRAQIDQINRLQKILRESDVEYQVDDVPSDPAIPGMPSADGMATLRTIEGDSFDQTFINLMTAHHRGAIILANRVLREGRSATIAQMARHLIQVQERQIYRLYEFYVDWYEPPAVGE